MPQPLRVTLVQANLAWEQVDENLRHFDQLLTPVKDAGDLIVLPEMFSTGFSMRSKDLAEEMNGPTIAWMRNLAQSAQAAVCGSLIISEKGHYYNRLVWVQPDGQMHHYDKRHRFTLGREHLHYNAGRTHLIVEFKGWKIMPLICYDLRFPVWSRNVQGYDLLIYVANWPDRRSEAWSSLLVARAIENQAYTLGVNRVGYDGNEVYHSGDSALVDYAGERQYHCRHREDVFSATLDWDAQQDFRKKLAFLEDRDAFSLEL